MKVRAIMLAGLIFYGHFAAMERNAAFAQDVKSVAPPRTSAGQKPAQPTAQPASPAPAESEGPPPTYEKELLRLAKLMGLLAYLQTLCHEADAPLWAKRMQALLDAEAPAPSRRRQRLVDAYNQGVQELGVAHHECTAAARTLSQRYADEGALLTRVLERKYGQ
jgi:uncharacterized protein (TIGR02301 family)